MGQKYNFNILKKLRNWFIFISFQILSRFSIGIWGKSFWALSCARHLYSLNEVSMSFQHV